MRSNKGFDTLVRLATIPFQLVAVGMQYPVQYVGLPPVESLLLSGILPVGSSGIGFSLQLGKMHLPSLLNLLVAFLYQAALHYRNSEHE